MSGEKDTVISLDDSDPYEGQYSALIETSAGSVLDPDDLTISALVMDNPVSMLKEHTYTISAAIRRDQGQWTRLILFSAGYGLVLTDSIDALDEGTSDTGWKRYSFNFRAPVDLAEVYVRFDSLVTNARTSDGTTCRMWVDDVQVIDLGVEEYADIYGTLYGGGQLGVRNRYFNKGTELEIRTIGGMEYLCDDMPLRWNMAMALDNLNNHAPGYPVWGQEVPSGFNDTTGDAVFIKAKAADLSRPAWPAITPDGVQTNITLLKYNGQRHVLTFDYGAAGDTLPLLRVFLINSNFSHYTSLFVDPLIDIPGNRMWPLSLHYTPDFGEDLMLVRFDNVTIGPNGAGPHTDETKVYLDNVIMGVIK